MPLLSIAIWLPIVSGALLTFARAVGEFGSTILVSGNLAGHTQTAPLYIFAKFNEGQIEAANAIAIVLALFSFVVCQYSQVAVGQIPGVFLFYGLAAAITRLHQQQKLDTAKKQIS